jgi:hypothetical protein
VTLLDPYSEYPTGRKSPIGKKDQDWRDGFEWPSEGLLSIGLSDRDESLSISKGYDILLSRI